MRRYRIEIDNGKQVYDSHPGGQFDPNNLQVELDITSIAGDTPADGCFVRIWGCGVQAINQAANLYQKAITVNGGMGPGLPLATAEASQYGLLAKGNITKAFANWIGTDQSLDLIFSAGPNTLAAPGPNPKIKNRNIVLNWQKGTPLSQALEQCLKQGFPDLKHKINLTKELKALQDEIAYFPNLQQLAEFCRRKSQDVSGDDKYQGVSMVPSSGTIQVFDSDSQQGGEIQFQDLIGMPTWIDFGTIQIKTVMRGDLVVGQDVTLPSYVPVLGLIPQSTTDTQLTFTGKYQIKSLRHVGHSRQPSAESWVTIIEAFTQIGATGNG